MTTIIFESPESWAWRNISEMIGHKTPWSIRLWQDYNSKFVVSTQKQVAKNSVPGYLPCKFTQRWCVRPFWGLHGCMNLCPNLLQTSQFWLWLRCSVYQVIEYLRVGDLWKSNSDVPFLWLKSKICNRRFFLPSALRFKLHGVVLL